MSRFLSLDELLNKKKPQVSKVVETPIVETPIVETPKVEDAPAAPTVKDVLKSEDTPTKPAKKSGRKTAIEA